MAKRNRISSLLPRIAEPITEQTFRTAPPPALRKMAAEPCRDAKLDLAALAPHAHEAQALPSSPRGVRVEGQSFAEKLEAAREVLDASKPERIVKKATGVIYAEATDKGTRFGYRIWPQRGSGLLAWSVACYVTEREAIEAMTKVARSSTLRVETLRIQPLDESAL